MDKESESRHHAVALHVDEAYHVGDAPREGLARWRPGIGQLLVVVRALIGCEQDACIRG